jgi:hypothetical protein
MKILQNNIKFKLKMSIFKCKNHHSIRSEDDTKPHLTRFLSFLEGYFM